MKKWWMNELTLKQAVFADFPFGVISNESFCFWNKMLLNSCFDITLFLLTNCAKHLEKASGISDITLLPRKQWNGVSSCATRNFPWTSLRTAFVWAAFILSTCQMRRWAGRTVRFTWARVRHKTITLMDGSLGRHAQGFTKKSQAISSN